MCWSCGALVLPDQIAVNAAANAFDETDNLREERQASRLRFVLEQLVESARQFV